MPTSALATARGGPTPGEESDGQAADSPLRFAAVLACFVLSGSAALMYQTAWVEELGLVFGASHLAVASVLAAYMAGLAAGAHLAGRWLDQMRRPLRAYAVIEVLIALAALAVPIAFEAASRLRIALFASDQLAAVGGPSSAAFYLVCTFVILFVPTAAMGASLPILARWVVERDRQLGPRVALLYGANTAGAAIGVVVTAFWLLPTWSLDVTIWIAASTNGAVGLLAWVLDARSGARGAPRETLPLRTDTPPREPARRRIAALAIIASSGFVAFGWEIVWTRLLTHLLGGSIYAFATMLTTFLVGIALGSMLAATWISSRGRAAVGLFTSQLGVAVASWAAFAALDPLARGVDTSQGNLLAASTLAAATLLPGALMMGAAFPCAVRLVAGDAKAAGTASAHVFAWNTVGAIGGAVAVGFLLLPALRFAGMACLLIGISLVSAFAAALLIRSRQPDRRTTRSSWAAGAALAGSAMLLVLPPATPWHTLRTAPLSNHLASMPTFYAVGRSATVLLHPIGRDLRLSTNGLPESLIHRPGKRLRHGAIARWLSMLPVTVRPEARSMMVIGLGAGITASSAPRSITQVDVVELEPEVVAANREVTSMRASDPLADPRLRIHYDDARSALQLTTQHYDVIVSQPSHPWTAGSSHLFTRELFELVRQRLTPDGVFVQWIGLRFVDRALTGVLIATLLEVFPHVEVYHPQPGGALVLMASRQPLVPTEGGFGHARDAWRALGTPSVDDLLLDRRLDAAGSRAFAAGSPVATDQRNLFKTRSPKVLRAANKTTADDLFANHDPLRSAMTSPDAVSTVRGLLGRNQVARGRTLAAGILDPRAQRIALGLVELRAGKVGRGRARLLRSLGEGCTPADPIAQEALAAVLLSAPHPTIARRDSALLDRAAVCDSDLATVLEGRRQLSLRNPARVQDLEADLAAVPPGHPAFRAATILRIAWRRQGSSRQHAAEGLALLEQILPARPRNGRLLLDRLLFAARAGDGPRLEDAANELVTLRGGRTQLLKQALAGLANVPASSVRPASALDTTRDVLRKRLNDSHTPLRPAADERGLTRSDGRAGPHSVGRRRARS